MSAGSLPILQAALRTCENAELSNCAVVGKVLPNGLDASLSDAAGLSQYEPDPIRTLAAAEKLQAAE
jgi:hypothetical protein